MSHEPKRFGDVTGTYADKSGAFASVGADGLPEVAMPSAAAHVLKIAQAVRTTDTHEMLVEVIKRELHAYALSALASRPVGDGGAEFVHVGWADDLTQERPRMVPTYTKDNMPAAAAEPYVIKLYAALTAGTDTAGRV